MTKKIYKVCASQPDSQPDSQPESQPESTVRNNRTPREDWEGFESPWESKISTEKESLTVQKPLTLAEINSLFDDIPLDITPLIYSMVRSIEKAHGIE